MTGREHKLRHYALDVMKQLWGTPYKWGGDDPMEGVDCSGSMNEALKSCGTLPYHGDWTAHQLFQMFNPIPPEEVEPGDLAFWLQDDGHAIHVEMVFDSALMLSIGAGGGGSNTTTIEKASKRNAYVKIRPIYNRGRKERVVFCNPYKEK